MNKYGWKAIITASIFIMAGMGLPTAIKYDHYIALLIWTLLFTSAVWD